MHLTGQRWIGILAGWLLVAVMPARAQVIPRLPIQTYHYDTNYVVNYDKLLALRLVIPRRFYNTNLISNKNKIIYRPNIQTAFGIGFTYKWLALDLVISPSWNEKRNEKFGDTREFNIKGSLYLKRHLVEGQFRNYKGMHIRNPQAYLSPWDGTYPYRPDIRSTYFMMGYTILANHREFSWRSVFQMDGLMRRSAGSFMFSTSLHLTFIKADSSLVPAAYRYGFADKARINTVNMATIQQAAGYAHVFVHKQFFLAVSAFPGLSLSIGSVYSEAGRYAPRPLNFVFETHNSIGYNSRRWYTGISFKYKYQPQRLADDISLNYGLGEIRLYVGYRIHAPYVVYKVIRDQE